MKKPMPGLNYYFLQVTAKPDGEIVHEAFTHWVGFTEHSPQREIRKGSIVRPEYFMQR